MRNKIFKPFFTTIPTLLTGRQVVPKAIGRTTGQGKGLGLSLSYDIVKAHGGEIKVNTKVDQGNPDHFGKNEGTEFVISLPS